ncbi:lipopolysaccharide assembly protein LapB [Shewanella sp.]|uniref:tetratricopeptide repeat protein n=1 Tax=Shewanella sp. TaxID=50422 RepID=UPI001ED4581E|nr:tetratricopeptide repeat protein [Shewanella sp.]NRB24565.1 tetratricopeptide repeat protein [Shewanella sp.]
MSAHMSLFKLNKQFFYVLLILLLILVIGSIFMYMKNSKESPLETGSILVLPVKEAVKSTVKQVMEPLGTQWSAYGEMDKLIRRLGSSERYMVLQVEDVIEIMKRASVLNDDLTIEDIETIFEVSGASLIIETEVLVDSEGSQLAYRLHQQQITDSGHFVGTDIKDSFLQLSNLINLKTGTDQVSINTVNDSRFVNPDIVRALELLQSGKLDVARTYLERVSMVEPDNVTAKRLLANVLIESREFILAHELLTLAIEQAKTRGNMRDLARLRLSLANNFVGKNEIERALPLLSLARQDAAKVKDWLYLAYIFELAGHVNQRLNRYAAARYQFKKSIHYHQKIRYPYGQVQGQNNLAELEFLDRNYAQAYRLTTLSLAIITHRNLPNILAKTLKLHSKVENKLQRIR